MEVTGSMPALRRTASHLWASTTKGDSGMYLLKHRAELHRVQFYEHTSCEHDVTQQKFDCDAVLECVGFTRVDSGCGFLILEEYDVRKCKTRYHPPIHPNVGRATEQFTKLDVTDSQNVCFTNRLLCFESGPYQWTRSTRA